MMIVDRWNAGVGKMKFFDMKHDDLESVPPIIFLRNVKFRSDFGEKTPKERRMKTVAIMTSSKENFDIRRLENLLASFLEVSVLSLEEAVNSKCSVVMQILGNSLNGMVITFRLVPELVEIGPRIKTSHVVWELV